MPNPMSAYDLSGRVAVVTGAASGIGRTSAEFLAAAGAAVVAADIDEAGLAGTVESITAAGGRAIGRRTDVTSRTEVEALLGLGASEFGRCDIMCNIAGAMFAGTFEDVGDDELNKAIDLNLRSVFYGCQAAIAAMKQAGHGGSIINVSSGAIDLAFPGIGLYALTKAAVAMMSMTMATEVGQYGIRVNAIAPGSTMTKFTTWRLVQEDGTIDQVGFDAFVERMRAMSPLGLVGEAEDQAHLILYLASDAARWVTGNIHRANGGQTSPW